MRRFEAIQLIQPEARSSSCSCSVLPLADEKSWRRFEAVIIGQIFCVHFLPLSRNPIVLISLATLSFENIDSLAYTI